MRRHAMITLALFSVAAPSAAAAPDPLLKKGKDTPALKTLDMCTAPTLLKPFARWNDNKPYFLVPGGDFEAAAAGWSLNKASVVRGGFESAHSLRLDSGESATSTIVCVGKGYPRWRFVARNTGSRKAGLAVETIYLDAKLQMRISRTKVLKMGAKWAPTRRLPLPVGLTGVASTGQKAPVAFRFTALGKGGKWHVDDVYVDPYARG
jgi:hypothetical protein